MNQQITLIQNKAIRQLLVGLNAAADLALSVHQYECFLRCAAVEGKGLAISTIAGLVDTTLNQKEYAHFKHALNRLMDGAPRRGRSGLQLLYRGDQASSISSLAARRAREVGVTDKGKELVRLTGQTTPMVRVLQEARGYQVATTLQLYAFLICALNSGESLQNALAKDYGGVEHTDARYQRIYGAIRQIRQGSKKTPDLHLVSYGDPATYQPIAAGHRAGSYLQLTYAGANLLERIIHAVK